MLKVINYRVKGVENVKKFAALILAAIISLLVAGCNKGVKPEERMNEYVELWNKQKFEEMYDYLSAETKETVKEEDFIDRYKKIYKDLGIDNLKVEFKTPEEKTDKKAERAEFPVSVSMDSIAGKIEFEQTAVWVKEEREDETNWYFNWDTTFIFPQLEKGDKVSVSTVPAERGEILDKNGEGLAINGTAYEIGIVPKDMGDNREEVINRLADLLGITAAQIEKALNQSWVQPEHFVPIKKIPTSERALLEEAVKLDGVVKRDVKARVYPLGEAAAHLVGYVGPITAEELEKLQGEGYQSTDLIGKRGLEQLFDKELKGQNGVKIYAVKADGSREIIAEQEVVHGKDIHLTIDSAIQKTIFEQMKGEAGTAAAIHPITGETLALVSSPSFDPNILTLGATAEQWKKLQDNELNPLLNRFAATYAPGSVMKPITAAIGLKEGAIDWKKTINVKGLKWQKDSSWGNYYVTRVSDQPNVNLEKALVYSDNIYFAQAALAVGKDKFLSGLQDFGFDNKGFKYTYPIQLSKAGKIGSDIALADSGYGQAQVETNVLHLAATYTTFVNDGNMIKPILLADEEKEQMWRENLVSAEDAKKISAALEKVVQDPAGTAYSGRMEGYPLAGKTGTAELKRAQGEQGKENGWFVAYNAENPSLLIAMMIEGVEGRGGSTVPVKIIKNIFEHIQ